MAKLYVTSDTNHSEYPTRISPMESISGGQLVIELLADYAGPTVKIALGRFDMYDLMVIFAKHLADTRLT